MGVGEERPLRSTDRPAQGERVAIESNGVSSEEPSKIDRHCVECTKTLDTIGDMCHTASREVSMIGSGVEAGAGPTDLIRRG